MEHNTPNFRLRLNLFDSIVILAALAVGAFLVWNQLKAADSVPSDPGVQDTVRYTVRLQRWAPGTSALVEEGDRIADNIKNFEIGHVVAVEAVPARMQVLDHESRRYVWAEIEGMEDVLVTIEAPCVADKESITVGGGYEVRVGFTAYIKGEGYLGSGPIVAMKQGVQG